MTNIYEKNKKKPNESQEKAIYFPYIDDKKYCDKNILVSAAAGSGKTWVLVERIINIISNETICGENNVSLKDLLVMTFTVKATLEMKKRIKEALDDKIKSTKDNKLKKKLIKECALIQNANITTIDAFCKNMLEENYIELSDENSLFGNLDLTYNVADNEELDILYDDCVDYLLDKYYDDEKFKPLFLSYIEKGNEDKFKKICNSLLKKFDSIPWPDEYMHNKLITFDEDNINVLKEYKSNIIKKYKNLQSKSDDMKKKIYEYYELASDSKYCIKEKSLDKFIDEHKMDVITLLDEFKRIGLNNENLDAFIKKIVKLPNIPGPSKDANESEALFLKNKKDLFKSQRDKYFNDIKELYESLIFTDKLCCEKELRDKFFSQDKLMLEFIYELYINVIEKKKKKNALGITDLSKLFLDILYDKNTLDNGIVVREISKRAENIAVRFKYIFIDEYQDTNYVQEMILKALSLDYKNNNVFMVGDLKQSIYGFRSSEPAIFANKYETYCRDLSKINNNEGLLINLDINYRSSKNILMFVNSLFSNVMNKEFGNIDYKNDGMLGIPKEKNENSDINKVKVSIIYNDCIDNSVDKNVFEAEYVAKQIEKLVLDSKCKYSDIVILHRSATSISNTYVDVLAKHGIPAYAQQKSGFFKSSEIVLIVDMLDIIDNPRQNVKIFNVLCSDIYNITNTEMALLKLAYCEMNNITKNEEFMIFDSIQFILMHNSEFLDKYKGYSVSVVDFYNKLKKFYDDYKLLSFYARFKSISNLIEDIYNITEIKNIYLSTKNGKLKGLNLDKFYNFAINYEKSSYVGLYNFLRYITKIDELDDDYGQAKVFDENDDVVNIMTIHSSKGLEFKNVFLCGCGRDYIKNDYNDTNITCFTEKYGIALNHIDFDNKYAVSTPKRDLAKMNIKNSLLEEELRVLYVALTRAVERLNIVAYANVDKKKNFSIQEMNDLKEDRKEIQNGRIYNYDITECDNYIDIILKFLHNNDSFCDINFENFSISNNQVDEKIELDIDNLINTDIKDTDSILLERFKKDNLDKMMQDTYLFNSLQFISPKKSVSDIKKELHIQMANEEKTAVFNEILDDDISISIDNESNKKRVDGTKIGNVYHKFMEDYTFDNKNSTPSNFSNLINYEKINLFLKSSIGRRMKEALINNKLQREQKFMHLLSNNDLYRYYGKNTIENTIDNMEQIVIQGIIDAFFIEKDSNTKEEYIVLVDYKTDKINQVFSDNEKDEFKKYLVNNYTIQLSIYKDILERITNLKVKEMYIYSFAIDEEILI